MKKAAIIYHYFAHYRAPVFKALAASNNTDYYFLGDPTPSDDIKRIHFESEKELKNKFLPLKNKWILRSFLWQSNLLKTLRNNNFDAVIFLGDVKFISTWIAILMIRLKGKKAYLWGHGIYGKESWLHLKIKLLFLRCSNGIFLYNNRAKQLYVSHGISSRKLTVIYNSLDFDETEYYRKNYLPENKEAILSTFSNSALPVIFCIGRLNKVKRIDMLIKAIGILKEQGILLNCFIIGDGEEKSYLQKISKDANIEGQVSFTGSLYKEQDISQYILASDLCVCPGAVGLTVIHSLSYGVPVLSNDNLPFQGPEFEAITPGISGDFYRDGDFQDMAEKIQTCIHKRMQDKNKSTEDCLSIIHDYYNPYFQRNAIDKVISIDNSDT